MTENEQLHCSEYLCWSLPRLTVFVLSCFRRFGSASAILAFDSLVVQTQLENPFARRARLLLPGRHTITAVAVVQPSTLWRLDRNWLDILYVERDLLFFSSIVHCCLPLCDAGIPLRSRVGASPLLASTSSVLQPLSPTFGPLNCPILVS